MTEWINAKLFHFVHSNNLVYNTCWEDPHLDRVALDLSSDDNVMMITSAGCNALDYALTGPNHIYAVDVNPRQNALLELKIAGIRHLEFEEFFAMFGKGRMPSFPKIYEQKLRRHLTDPARKHWDRHTNYFTGTPGRSSFYFRGTSGVVAKLITTYMDLSRIRKTMISMFDLDSIAEQQAVYNRYLRDVLWRPSVKWALSRDFTLSLIGVPGPQIQQVERGYVGGIAKFMEDCVESVFTRLPLNNNYFWWLYINGEYTPERCPEYLKRENFELLRSGLVDKISVHTQSILDFLEGHEGEISRFVLLDHMDWLSTYNLPVLKAEWQAMIDKASPNARWIWRSGGMQTDFVDPIPVQFKNRKTQVGSLLRYNQTLASDLHKRDRVHTYGSFYIGDLVGAF